MLCIVCNKDFTPTDPRHKACGNACVHRIYVLRRKVRGKINAALKLLKTPADIKDFDNSLQDVLEGVAQ